MPLPLSRRRFAARTRPHRLPSRLSGHPAVTRGLGSAVLGGAFGAQAAAALLPRAPLRRAGTAVSLGR